MDIEICSCCGKPKKPKVGNRKQTGAKFKLTQETIDNGGFNDPSRKSFDVNGTATDLASIWSGHRYGLQCLKPALEPVIVFQKPYEGSPIDNITSTGAGALWIDGGRIGTDEMIPRNNMPGQNGAFNASGGVGAGGMGRWPANLVLTHAPECERIGTRRVKGSNAHFVNTEHGSVKPNAIYGDIVRNEQGTVGYADANGYETIDAWQCIPSCPVARLGAQSGESLSRIGTPRGADHGNGWGMQATGSEYDDTGTAARYFYAADWMLDRLEAADNPLDYSCVMCDRKEQRHGIMTGRHNSVKESTCAPVTNAESSLSQPNESADSALTPVQDSQRHDRAGKSGSKSTHARSAKSSLKSSQETIESFAQPSVATTRAEQIARDAKFVTPLCDSCATAIAQSLVAMQQGIDPALQLGRASMPERKKRILIQSLALFAAIREPSDTTPTIADLSTLFGFVRLAITNTTPAKERPDPVIYFPKASTAEREAGLDPRQTALMRLLDEDAADFEDSGRHHTAYGEFQGVPGSKQQTANSRRQFDPSTVDDGRDPRHVVYDRQWRAYAKCPEHGKSLDANMKRTYTCGCPIVRGAQFDPSTVDDGRDVSIDNPYQRGETTRRNIHPTIKPISLSRYLATLLLPPAAYGPRRLLIPFAGAGSEAIGAMLAGWEEITGVEIGADHVAIANARIAYWKQRAWELSDPDRKPTVVSASPVPAGQLDMFMED